MANVFRYMRGDVRALELPAYTADAVEIGDLIYWDSVNGAARPAETISGANYTQKKQNLAAAFLGAALTAKAAGASGNLLVATTGDYLFAAPSGAAYTVGEYLAGGNGTAMQDQGVVKTTDAAEAIGLVLAAKASAQTTVQMRILSRVENLQPGAVVAGQTLSNSLSVPDGGGVSFGTSGFARNGNNILASLPTSNPGVAGALWVDNGVVKVSAGT